jgi:hypothetical protein
LLSRVYWGVAGGGKSQNGWLVDERVPALAVRGGAGTIPRDALTAGRDAGIGKPDTARDGAVHWRPGARSSIPAALPSMPSRGAGDGEFFIRFAP